MMSENRIIVIGASAGGVEALVRLVGGLPENLGATIFIALHVPPNGKSVLPSILTRSGALPARHPKDFDAIIPGEIVVAPPDHHLLVADGYIRLTRGPKENGHRPSIDPLFRSAARMYGSRVIGVILSGSRDDGTVGLVSVKECGGIALVQDPAEAIYPSMPTSAIENVLVDYILPIGEIPAMLERLVLEPPPSMKTPECSGDNVEDTAMLEGEEQAQYHVLGIPSGYMCPDCGGALWELGNEDMLRFRCRVGHAWSPESLLDEEKHHIEEALWVALRTLQEQEALMKRVAARAKMRGNIRVVERFSIEAAHLQRRATVLRRLLLGGETGEPDPPDQLEKQGGIEPSLPD
jgi:two-component system chemotaxis response regulator CheB